MYLLIESIKVKDGQVFNLPFHNQRLNQARRILWNCKDEIELSKALIIPPELGNQLVKCRVLYGREIKEITFKPYSLPVIGNLKIICDDNIEYPLKYADRSAIDRLFKMRQPCDDILIVKKNLLTDSSFCNVVLQKDGIYFTSSSCLLNGTKRQLLLQEGEITETEITFKSFRQYETLHLINAMIDLEDDVNMPIEQILDKA